MRMRNLALLAVVPAVFGLAACGGGADDGVASANGGTQKPTSSPTASLDPHEAALKYAQCMRQHGIQMDDPKGNDGKVSIRLDRGSGSRAKMEAAQKACQHFMAAGGRGPKMDDPKMRDQLLKYAKCMRDNGIDMPDPKPGHALQMPAPDEGSRAKFEAAQKACQKYQPGSGRALTQDHG